MPRPDNVPAERVIDFDIYRALAPGVDLHRCWRALMDESPYPLMWTPRNGGHWIVLRGELADVVMSDSERFSNRTILVPKDTAGEAYRLIPLSLDPPEHRPFRNLLNENLGPKGLKGIDEKIAALTVELIEGFRPRGRCDFALSYLAQNNDLRRRLVADPSLIEDALLEFFRRFPLGSSSREVRRDVEWEGVQLRAGDMVMAPTIVVALDDAMNADPLAFELGRPGRRHSTFGKGSHTCPGAHLARMEMKIVLREWLARIPEFRLAPGSELSFFERNRRNGQSVRARMGCLKCYPT